ncbi:MAG: helix-turn-helix domain-containing protein [Candidatus Onthomonas sp.]
MRSNIGQKIKAARKSCGLTQKELADKIGKGFSTVQKYENGQVEPPTSVIAEIARILGITPLELAETVISYPGEADEPDRDYELVCDALADAGMSIESTGFCDQYYVWHTDADSPEEDRVEYDFRDLLQVVRTVQKDADTRKAAYIRKRLEAEIF